ncbi:uncharacterized protein LOC143377989 [Andrena cerasifolii]|uniref:uncharacterized protein LOC143377989 n=1 Tax=Andrena cerasifolii TaxID=2819439 RepID=UPI00403842AB
MIRALILLLLADLLTATVLPEVTSYAKVSRNGQEQTQARSDQTSWITRMVSLSNGTASEARGIKNIAITVSPVYISPKIPKLQHGEAVDYPSAGRYSTLDHELIAQLNTKKKIQDRYHPASLNTFKNKDPSNGMRESSKPRPSSLSNRPPSGPPNGPPSSFSNGPPSSFSNGPPSGPPNGPPSSFSNGPPSGPPNGPPGSFSDGPPGSFSDGPPSGPPDGPPSSFSNGPPSGPLSSSTFDFSKPPFSDSYEYKPPVYLSDKPMSKPPDYMEDKPISKPQDYMGDKPISKPLSMDDYTDFDANDKPPDSYKQEDHFTSHDHPPHDSDYPKFPDDSSYTGGSPPKPIEYSAHLDHPPFVDEPYDHHHDFHHELIYDHIPEYHEHHEHHDHTEEPEMNDQRLDKRPYSYYFIGKKLWYVPLYFSIYFIIYIAALVLKSIARHKITFPEHLAGHSRSYTDFSWWHFTERILEGVENFAEKYKSLS